MQNPTYKKGFFTLAGSGGGTGDLLADGTIPLTANWDVGAYTITALRFISDQATGTAPFTVASTTVVANLNASLLGGNAASAFATAAHTHAAYLNADGTVPLTANWDVGAFTITANGFTLAANNEPITFSNGVNSHIIKQSAAEGIAGGTDLRIGLDDANQSLIICPRSLIDTDWGQVVHSDHPVLWIYLDANNHIDITPTHMVFRGDYAFKTNDAAIWHFGASLAAADAYTWRLDSGDGLTDADGRQAWMKIEPGIKQTGTAAYDAIYVNVTEASVGDGSTGDGNNLLNLAVATASKFKIGNAGNIIANGLINAASGDESAFTLNYTTNKAAGADTGLVVNQTDTASPGTSLLFDAKVATASKFSVRNDGLLFLGSSAQYIYPASANTITIQASTYMTFQTNTDLTTGNKFPFDAGTRAITAASGTQAFFAIGSKTNQSGTAAATDLLINRTETAVGSGTQRLLSAQVGSVERFGVDNRGGVVVGLTSDAIIQVGQIVMADAGTDGRYDINGANGTLAIGVLGGSGSAAAAAARGPVVSGNAYVAMAEDVAVTRGHVLYQSATAGFAADNSALQAAGLNIGIALYSEALYAFTAPGGVTTNTITLDSAPGWAVGDPVIYWQSGDATVPTGLTTGTVYFIKTIATAAITLSLTRGGAAVAITENTGSGTTMYFQRLPLALINIR